MSRLCLVLLVLFSAPLPALAQDKMPVDPAVTIGTLPNGLRYYVRENRRPEKRAALRLVVNAGSILEDPDQRGLAHFAEHMAFNGTTHFPKQQLVDFLQRIGMRFGADLNAYTSFDETVYQLTVPTDTAQLLEQGIQILEDWAHAVTFDTTEIRKERGVVVEEWRLHQGAGNRLQQKQFPVLFRGSRYAEREPIGTKASLESFAPEALRRFYRDWYRPDLMAVVAVGDFDKHQLVQLIQQHFARIPAPQTARPRPAYGIPPRDSAAAVVAADKEATNTSVYATFLRPAATRGTIATFRSSLIAGFYSSMLNARLGELAQKPDPPFLGAGGGVGSFVRLVDAFSLGAAVVDTGVRRGLTTMLTEVERVERHGFLPSELARAKRETLRSLEQAYAERNHLESEALVGQYVAHFLSGEPIASVAQRLELSKRLLSGITLAEVNRTARTWLSLKDRVLLVSGPEKPGLTLPPGDSLLALVDQVGRLPVAPYTETVSDAPLVTARLPEAAIVSETHDAKLNTTTWTLANGVRVILKPTDFKADQVLLTAESFGGTSLMPDSVYPTASMASTLVTSGGVGSFSAIDLQKKLAGNTADADSYIGRDQEGLSGSASPEDLRTLFELVYLRFTAPRADSAVFEATRALLHTYFANRNADPAAAFEDTLRAILTQRHPRSRPFTTAMVDSLNLGQAMALYRDRFADASDFTFVLVGNFTPERVRPLVRRYLGNLPALHRGEKVRDLGITPPDGVVEREVHKGIEPKAQTQIVFTGPLPDSRPERATLGFLAEVLELKLLDQLREERGGTYGVGVSASISRVPRSRYSFTIRFGSAPERTRELFEAVFTQIDSLRRSGPTEKELIKVKEGLLRRRETEFKENGFWLQQLVTAAQYGDDPHNVLDVDTLLKQLTRENIQRAAQQYLDSTRYVRVTLLPEATDTTGQPKR